VHEMLPDAQSGAIQAFLTLTLTPNP
jgi:hypothetical protein